MTVIAYKDGVMASDRNCLIDGQKFARKKVRKVRGHLIGGTGSSDQIENFICWFANGALEEHFKPLDATHILVVSPKREVCVYASYHAGVRFIGHAFAIGSGAEAARGAMAAGASARYAVQIAAKVCDTIGGGVDVERL